MRAGLFTATRSEFTALEPNMLVLRREYFVFVPVLQKQRVLLADDGIRGIAGKPHHELVARAGVPVGFHHEEVLVGGIPVRVAQLRVPSPKSSPAGTGKRRSR